jgi:hypothetical protein
VADLDVEVLRSFSDRMAASYEAAQQYAYCPGSEPYRRLMKQARDAKRALDACFDAAGVLGTFEGGGGQGKDKPE